MGRSLSNTLGQVVKKGEALFWRGFGEQLLMSLEQIDCLREFMRVKVALDKLDDLFQPWEIGCHRSECLK